jgi:amino acid permease
MWSDDMLYHSAGLQKHRKHEATGHFNPVFLSLFFFMYFALFSLSFDVPAFPVLFFVSLPSLFVSFPRYLFLFIHFPDRFPRSELHGADTFYVTQRSLFFCDLLACFATSYCTGRIP